jgi:hypothetical protein
MSTKWYVRDVIRQQNAINWRLASDLRTLEGRVADLETRLAEARESLDSRPTDSTAVPGNADHLQQADRL